MIEFHPLANIFPLIEGEDFAGLVKDVRENGLREPIVLLEGKILDGRNRYRACVAAGLLPESLGEITAAQIKYFHHHVPAGKESPSQAQLLEFVWSKNFHRRHLSTSQRAIVMADYEAFRHGGVRRSGQDANLHLGGIEPEPAPPTRADLAERGHVSERLLASAAVVRDHAAPEVKEAVRQGGLAVSAAEEIASRPVEEQRAILESLPRDEAGKLTPEAKKALAPIVKEIRAEKQGEKKQRREQREVELAAEIQALPEEKFGVIYADPEWRFEVYSRDTGMDRAADNHYPTSSTDSICARPVGDIAADDAVLFLWATVPMLADALRVMAAWGFTYKSHAAWIKDRPGTGYWFRNRHELLLVGTKGNVPAPAPGMQLDSVFAAPLGPHSEKPDAAYEMIERYFPTLPKIELNARRVRPGWERWGNEAPPAEAAE